LLARLPERVAAAVVEFMIGPLLEGPERVGEPLRRELVYRIDDETNTVRVVRIEHRADVYRQR
jgi:mRNA interferase RelE/StbE